MIVVAWQSAWAVTNQVAAWTVCVIGLPILAACSGSTTNEHQTNVHSGSLAAKPRLSLARERNPVVRDLRGPSRLRFDLVCEMHWRVLSDFLPDEVQPYATNTPSQSFSRDIVDLGKMATCDPSACTSVGPRRIADVNAERIQFYDEPGTVWWVRWRDGRSYLRHATGHRVEEARGSCRQERFSGFPQIDERYLAVFGAPLPMSPPDCGKCGDDCTPVVLKTCVPVS